MKTTTTALTIVAGALIGTSAIAAQPLQYTLPQPYGVIHGTPSTALTTPPRVQQSAPESWSGLTTGAYTQWNSSSGRSIGCLRTGAYVSCN